VICGTWRGAEAPGILKGRASPAVSWPELTRFVAEVDADPALHQAVQQCRSQEELVLKARQLGFRITRIDLQRAWQQEKLKRSQHSQEEEAQG
jgi:predicted ribosomally synthesized peptide with nif11-like leader